MRVGSVILVVKTLCFPARSVTHFFTEASAPGRALVIAEWRRGQPGPQLGVPCELRPDRR